MLDNVQTVTLTFDAVGAKGLPIKDLKVQLRRVHSQHFFNLTSSVVGSRSVVNFGPINVALDSDGHGSVDLVVGTYSVQYIDRTGRCSDPIYVDLDSDSHISEFLQESALSVLAGVTLEAFVLKTDLTVQIVDRRAKLPTFEEPSRLVFAVPFDLPDIEELHPVGSANQLTAFQKGTETIEINGVEYNYWISLATWTKAQASGKTWMVRLGLG